jgi:hypothetical protein
MRQADLLHHRVDSDTVDAMFAKQLAGGGQDALAGIRPAAV